LAGPSHPALRPGRAPRFHHRRRHAAEAPYEPVVADLRVPQSMISRAAVRYCRWRDRRG